MFHVASARTFPFHRANGGNYLYWRSGYHHHWSTWLYVCLTSNCKVLFLIILLVRSSISIVPQSPDLFEGTLRENIDPVGEHQDADIWVAITQAHLREYVESLPESLDTMVREGGSSLSSGQRQLLCFARALLRKVRSSLPIRRIQTNVHSVPVQNPSFGWSYVCGGFRYGP